MGSNELIKKSNTIEKSGIDIRAVKTDAKLYLLFFDVTESSRDLMFDKSFLYLVRITCSAIYSFTFLKTMLN